MRLLLSTIFINHGSGYIPIAAEKAHARIIWDCGWAIEGDVFATASRDKTVYLLFMPRSSSHISSLCAIQVKIWNLNDGKWKAKSTLATGQPATAVAFTSLKKNKRFVFSRIRTYTRNDMACRRRYLAVGLESGEILIYSALSSSVEDWQLNVKIDSRYAFSFST